MASLARMACSLAAPTLARRARPAARAASLAVSTRRVAGGRRADDAVAVFAVAAARPRPRPRPRRATTAAGAAKTAAPIETIEAPPGGVWSGLDAWRASPIDRRYVWGERTAVDLGVVVPPGPWADPTRATASTIPTLPSTLAECADLILRTADPAIKAALSHRAYAAFVAAEDEDEDEDGGAARRRRMKIGRASPPDAPARPTRPTLVHPKDVPSPKTCELGMSAAMMHNIAHIELNAIDLAWDTVARFSALAAADDDDADEDDASTSSPPPLRRPDGTSSATSRASRTTNLDTSAGASSA